MTNDKRFLAALKSGEPAVISDAVDANASESKRKAGAEIIKRVLQEAFGLNLPAKIQADQILSRVKSDDPIYLEDAISSAADANEEKRGIEILKRYHKQLSRLYRRGQQKDSKKPGPRKAASTNLVDEELRRLVAMIRVIMKWPAEKSKLSVLEELAILLEEANLFLREFVLFTRNEGQSFQWLAHRSRRARSVDIRRCFRSLAKVAKDIRSPEVSVVPLSNWKMIVNSRQKDNKPESASYDLIGTWLRLEVQDLTRSQILKTAYGRLIHLKELFDSVEIAIPSHLLSELYRIACRDFMPRDEAECREFFGSMSDLLIRATKRQGVHPFQIQYLELLNRSDETVEEGAIATGG